MVFSERVTYDISLMLSLSRKISHHNVHTYMLKTVCTKVVTDVNFVTSL